MHRDMSKLITEYGRRFGTSSKYRHRFELSELLQILDSTSDKYTLIENALEAGFICGYQAAQMDASDQGKKPPTAPKLQPAMYDNENTLPF